MNYYLGLSTIAYSALAVEVVEAIVELPSINQVGASDIKLSRM
jgi:hypothetical protein